MKGFTYPLIDEKKTKNINAKQKGSYLLYQRGEGCVKDFLLNDLKEIFNFLLAPNSGGNLFVKRNIIPYDHSLKEKARRLRNNSTFTEVMLWQQLKKKQLLGYDFHRQKPIGHYIVDFFCCELNLTIEVDGESHYGNEGRDLKRQNEIEKLGVRFLRFDDLEVRHNLDGVVKVIMEWIVANTSLPTPRPPREGTNSLKK